MNGLNEWKAFSWFILFQSVVGGSDEKIFRQQRAIAKLFYTFIQTFFLSDEEWEKDLAAEIQDFDMVDDQNVDESDLDDLK